MAVASKFIDGVKNDELRTMLATHYTPISINAPTPQELRLKSKEYLVLKLPMGTGYCKIMMAILTMDLLTRVTTGTNLGTTWTRNAFVQTAVRQIFLYKHAQHTNKE